MLIWIYQYHIWLFALASLTVKYCSILWETYTWFGFALPCWYQIIRLLDTCINVHEIVLPWNVCPHILITNPNKARRSTRPVRDSIRSLLFCKRVNGTLLENVLVPIHCFLYLTTYLNIPREIIPMSLLVMFSDNLRYKLLICFLFFSYLHPQCSWQ